METSVNQQFIESLNWLKNRLGTSYTAAGRRIGVDADKIKSIRHGRSTADQEMLEKLLEAYPELPRGEIAPKTKFEERMEWLERENAKLRSENEELRNRLLKLADKLLEK